MQNVEQEKKVLREKIRKIIFESYKHDLNESCQRKNVLLEQGEGFRKGGFFDDFARGGGFIAGLFEPFEDVWKTIKWGITYTVRTIRGALGKFMKGMQKDLGIITQEEFDSYREQENEALKKIDAKYNEVLTRNKDYLFGGAAAGYAMMFNPALFIGAKIVQKSPDLAASAIRVMSGDDENVSAALSEMGLEEKPVDRYRLNSSGEWYVEQELASVAAERKKEFAPYRTMRKSTRQRAGYEPNVGPAGLRYMTGFRGRFGGRKESILYRDINQLLLENALINEQPSPDTEVDVKIDDSKKQQALAEFMKETPNFDKIEQILGVKLSSEARAAKPFSIIDKRAAQLKGEGPKEFKKVHVNILKRLQTIMAAESITAFNSLFSKTPIKEIPDPKPEELKPFVDEVKAEKPAISDSEAEKIATEDFKSKMEDFVLYSFKKRFLENQIKGWETRLDKRSDASLDPNLSAMYVDLVSKIKEIPVPEEVSIQPGSSAKDPSLEDSKKS